MEHKEHQPNFTPLQAWERRLSFERLFFVAETPNHPSNYPKFILNAFTVAACSRWRQNGHRTGQPIDEPMRVKAAGELAIAQARLQDFKLSIDTSYTRGAF